MAKKEQKSKVSEKEVKKIKKAVEDSKPSKKSDKTENAVKSKKDKQKAAKADGKDLTPLEKARIAKAAGGKGTTKAKKKNALPIFKAPEDFKPHFITVRMKVEKDGLLAAACKATRYQGRYDPDADDKKKFDIAVYDPQTVQGILSRFSMVTYATNVAKRLPAGAMFQALIRVNRKSADGSLSVIFKGLEQAVKNEKSGRTKLKPLDKKDPIYRKFRKAARILPSAFKEVLMPPKRTRGANKKDASDDE